VLCCAGSCAVGDRHSKAKVMLYVATLLTIVLQLLVVSVLEVPVRLLIVE
jgi:hypothetical protein